MSPSPKKMYRFSGASASSVSSSALMTALSAVSVARAADGLRALYELLSEKDHQEGHDGRARVDDQLSGLGEAEDRSRHRPDDDDRQRRQEGHVMPGNRRGPMREPMEPPAHHRRLSCARAFVTGHLAGMN